MLKVGIVGTNWNMHVVYIPLRRAWQIFLRKYKTFIESESD